MTPEASLHNACNIFNVLASLSSDNFWLVASRAVGSTSVGRSTSAERRIHQGTVLLLVSLAQVKSVQSIGTHTHAEPLVSRELALPGKAERQLYY